MADDIDRANDYAERHRQSALAAIPRYQGESSTECHECGDPIPQRRRLAVPGCTLCIHCQTTADRHQATGFWP